MVNIDDRVKIEDEQLVFLFCSKFRVFKNPKAKDVEKIAFDMYNKYIVDNKNTFNVTKAFESGNDDVLEYCQQFFDEFEKEDLENRDPIDVLFLPYLMHICPLFYLNLDIYSVRDFLRSLLFKNEDNYKIIG